MVFAELSKASSIASTLPDTLGLRINEIVELWYQASPWQGQLRREISERIIDCALGMIEQQRPLLISSSRSSPCV
ncbi:hypothetical protein [Sodalis glossinidius]|uniref:hypothetical protein n=1 Tax=Sodalis glossinidius TaxID=63612 RepID=UPI0002D6B52B|nr:hypothetical protein [Sodalis glossinidius]